MKGTYPEIQGGGSLILAWQIRNKKILVVGGGEVSTTCIQQEHGSDD
jgi:precorrin-2 dehydrogenase/sirohydrochlorin ferrochelatase